MHYLREPYTEPVEDEWFGWCPMTYDGKPIIVAHFATFADTLAVTG